MPERLAALVGGLLIAIAIATPAPARAQVTLSPVADTFVNAGQPAKRYGQWTYAYVGTSPERRFFVRFDARGVTQPIRRAWLRVLPKISTSRGFDVRHVASDTWEERTTTWSTQPAFSAVVTGSSGALTGGRWAAVEVTSLLAEDRVLSLALTPGSAPPAVAATTFRRGSPPRRRRAARRAKRRLASLRPAKRRLASPRARAAAVTAELHTRETGADGPQLVVETGPPPPDTTPPQVQLTQPAPGSVLSGSADLAAAAADDVGVDRVEFLADGQPVGVDGTAPYTATLDTRALADGDVTLTARAVDGAGNAATSAGHVVTIRNAVEPPPPDTIAPETTLTGGPSDTQRSGLAHFSFTADEIGAVFECSLDGAPFAPCRSGEAIHVANGGHTLAVRAVDLSGNADPSPVERRWWADATLQNGLFEASPRGWSVQGLPTPGWAGYQSAIAILPGGVGGAKARVSPVPGVAFYSMDSSPHPVNSTTVGTRYAASGQVRSDTPGKQVCLQVRERNGAAIVATNRTCVTATTGWQPFPETALVATAGGHQIEVDVLQQTTAADGDSFEVDGLELHDGGALTVTPPATPDGDPVLLALADVASCWSSGDEATARLLDTLGGTIAIAGDTEQNRGSADEFAGCYEPAWGRHRARTRPAVGDHEYNTPGAVPYWDYFGSAAGPRGQGWHSYDLGSWHVVVLNSNCEAVGGCGPGSEQYEWLQADLAANARDCTAAYFHFPLFSAGSIHGGKPQVRPFWDLLHAYSAEFVFGGNDHTYQRFAPQTPSGALDAERGMRQFVVGTGGTEHYPLGPPLANTEVQHTGTFGALRFTLRPGSYEWRFVPQSGKSFTDSGTTACSPLAPPPDTTAPDVRMTSPQDGAQVSGDVPLAADASDPSGVARVEFLAGGEVVATDTAAPYTATWNTSGHSGAVALAARAFDTAGNARTSAPVNVTVAAPDTPNLLPNGGFESSLTGWWGYRATLSRVAGGAEGAWSARARWNGAGSSYSMMTDPKPVGPTPAGARYTGSAWVRSETPGRTVCLRMREFNASGGVMAASTAGCLVTTATWQKLPDARLTAAGGASLDLYLYGEGPVAGDSFDVDAVRLTSP
jgi:hypothetical protein